MTDLTGPRVKLERALQQRREIYDAWTAWRDAGNLQVHEIDSPDGGIDLVLRLQEPIPIGWGAIVGDMIHNLRSSLDLLVHEWVREASGEAAWTRVTGFPIAESEEKFSDLLATRAAGVAPAARTKIEEVRAFPGGGSHGDALYRLHRLDIRDKHKLLTPVVLRGGRFGLIWRPPNLATESPDPPAIMIEPAKRSPVADGSVILHVALGAGPLPGQTKHSFEHDLGVETDRPGEFVGLPELLQEVGIATEATINAFRDQ